MNGYIPITALKNLPNSNQRLNDWDDLSFAKVSVFSPVDFNDVMYLIATNQIPQEYFWEYQQTLVLDTKIVTPTKIKVTTKRLGNSRKIKSRKYNLNTCRMSFTSHSLERFYERSGRREYSAKDFYNTKFDGWIDSLEMFQNHRRKWILGVKESTVKSNWIVPFGYGVGQGAFLGTITTRAPVLNERYRVLYKNNQPMFISCNGETGTIETFFAARTFIHHSQMHKEQRQVCDLILDGKYEDAFELNFSMQRDEKISVTNEIGKGDSKIPFNVFH
jgi:hypothetical protein